MRIRWLRNLKQLLLGFLTVLVVPVIIVKLSQKSSLRLLGIVVVCLLMLWWARTGDDSLCDGHQIQKQICHEFSNRQITGDLCHDFCVTGLYQLSGCGGPVKHGRSRTFQVLYKGAFLSDLSALVTTSPPILRPGMLYQDFRKMVTTMLVHHLDVTPEIDVLVTQLMNHFDFNRNAQLSYEEAETLWRQITQPAFLNNYLFQSTGAVPHLNGSCGGLSVWHQSHTMPYLYNSQALWLLSLVYPKAYRFTLPSWPKRAKVVLSLLEFAEHLMETFGARFHLCNISGTSLHYNKQNEIFVSKFAQLLSSHQIQLLLVNQSCHHDHDCILTPHCQTKCQIRTQTCTDQLARPTVAHICDIIKDYLVFDAPKEMRAALARRVLRCQNLFWSSSHEYLVKHSVIVLEIKAMLWRYIQDINKL